MALPPDAVIHKVGPESGTDLAHFLAEVTPGKPSVRSIRRALDQGRCLVNGQAENFGSRKLRRNDIVIWIPPRQTVGSSGPSHRFARSRVLFAEQGIVAYDKPPGLPVTRPDGGKGGYLEGSLRGPLGVVGAGHRLDADTSGVVLLATDPAALEHLQRCFAEHLVQKTYFALVRGTPKERGSRTTYLILQEQGQGFERWGTGRGSGAMQARTVYERQKTIGRQASLMKVQPTTGRTHQIRVHMSELGHPLIGDRVYGDRQDPILVSRHMLHAAAVTLPLPDGSSTTIQAPIPTDFREAMDLLATI